MSGNIDQGIERGNPQESGNGKIAYVLPDNGPFPEKASGGKG